MCCCDTHYFLILPFSFKVDESFQWLWNKLSLHWKVLQWIELSCINHHNKLSCYLRKCNSNFQFNIKPDMSKLALTDELRKTTHHIESSFQRISCWINNRHLERGEKLGWVGWGREFGEILACANSPAETARLTTLLLQLHVEANQLPLGELTSFCSLQFGFGFGGDPSICPQCSDSSSAQCHWQDAVRHGRQAGFRIRVGRKQLYLSGKCGDWDSEWPVWLLHQ